MFNAVRVRVAISLPSLAMAITLVAPSIGFAQSDKLPLTNDVSLGRLFELMGQTIEAQTPSGDFQQFAFRATFHFPHDATYANPVLDQDPRSNQIFGIDVSHHLTDACHCKLNWSLLAQQGVAFAYLKASQGTHYYDPSFEPNLAGIRAVPAGQRLQVGAFHFLSANGSGEDQAKNFLEVTGSKIGNDDLVPSLDLEWDVRTDASGHLILGPDGKAKDFWVGTDGQVILSRALAWLQAVQAQTNKVPILYTNETWWKERIGSAGKVEDLLPKYKIWISDLSSKGLKVEQPYVYRGGWNLWQFSFTATADQGGLPTGHAVDADVFYGDVASFDKALR